MPGTNCQMTARAPTISRSTGLSEDVVAAPPTVRLDFQTVYRSHFDYVWRTLRAFGIEEAQIEDAVQDVFVVVHRRLREFEGRARIESWLFAIAQRVAQRHWRTRSRRREAAGPLPEVADPAENGPSAAAERAQAAQLLVQLLDGMQYDQREVFVLVEVHEFAVTQAAATLDVNVNTAYSRLRLARRQFEKALGEYLQAEPSEGEMYE